MRFISKFAMTAAAIFFALSVSAHAGGHDTTSTSIGSKVYQVCKKWRVDQGGWMATDQMQHCRNVLFCASSNGGRMGTVHGNCMADLSGYNEGRSMTAANVDTYARNAAKACLQDGNC